MIIPNTEESDANKDNQTKADKERPFFLRVFSSEPMDLVQMPNTIE